MNYKCKGLLVSQQSQGTIFISITATLVAAAGEEKEEEGCYQFLLSVPLFDAFTMLASRMAW